MLIHTDKVKHALEGINITGVLHIGAHECEDMPFYASLGVKPDDIIWIDAIPTKVQEALSRGIPNVFNAVITDEDGKDIRFNVSNNVQSEHPDIHYTEQIDAKSQRIDTFLLSHEFESAKYNFWNVDIQGAELMALKGGQKSMAHVRAIYLEVNEKELYVGCALINEIDEFLNEHGFKRVLTEMTQHGWGDALYVRQTQNKKNTATIEIRGGLGNQLFQIFTLFAFCYDNNLTPILPYAKTCDETPPRKLYWDGFLSKLRKHLGETDNNVLYQEPGVHYTPFPLGLCSKNVKLMGQYMSHMYFDRCKDRIFNEIGLGTMKYELSQKYSYIFAEPNVRRVSLHFRLGDYLDKQCYHPVMPISYYIDAITRLMTENTAVERWVFYAFFEKPFEREINERISQLYSVFAESHHFEIRKVPKQMTDEEELIFMSMCHDNVLANSTFSWWGAYMNDEKTQRVIYPRPWYGHQLYYLESEDMFPINWCALDVQIPECNCYELWMQQQK